MTSNSKQPRHGYGQDFHLHREHTRAHLNGKQDNDKALLPSFFPPASFWTSSEKDLFFHGLSVFSRLRPDLIAEHIKTKSTLDVCIYLDALHAASLQQCPNIPTRMMVEPAMEVSERWVEREENLAQKLATSDRCNWSFGRTGVDNSRNRASCSCLGDTIRKSLPSDFEAEANGYLNHLDPTCLAVMESFIREAEPEDADLQHLPSLEFTAGSTLIGSASGDPVAGASNDQPSGSEDHADQPMGPQLSQLSEEVENELYRQTLLRRRLRKRLHMRRKRAEQTGRTIIMEGVKLRPGRPRKHPKPPNNQRKELSKDEPVEGANRGHDDDSLSPMPESSKTPIQSSSEGADDDEDLINERHGLGGTTKPYRVKEFFQESSMDGQAFSGMDLDFFHLSTLGRLLRLFTSLDESPRNLDDVSISTQSIQLMVKITKEFVSEIIHHAIITKEQEIRLKRSLRVWKYDRDEINYENVAECLTSMGLTNISKEQYFTKLLEKTKLRSKDRSYPDEDLAGNEQSSGPTDPAQPAGFILPQSLQWCSLPHYQQFYPADELLSELIDEEQLKKELVEEDVLDKEDELRSTDFEAFLREKDRVDTQLVM